MEEVGRVVDPVDCGTVNWICHYLTGQILADGFCKWTDILIFISEGEILEAVVVAFEGDAHKWYHVRICPVLPVLVIIVREGYFSLFSCIS